MRIPKLEWHEAVASLEPYVLRISTPDGHGTGFLVSWSLKNRLCGVVTAAHVIDHAHYWEEPIRLLHHSSGKTVLLRPPDRAIRVDSAADTGVIVLNIGEIPMPDAYLQLPPKDKYLKPGVEIGWLGFPAIRGAGLCFFSGRVSAYLMDESTYLVDGVAINGVSGGPAFCCSVDSAQMIGLVSAYIPNRATGEVLPGVAVVRDVSESHSISEGFRSMDEAQAEQTQPIEPPPPAPVSPEGSTMPLPPGQSA